MSHLLFTIAFDPLVVVDKGVVLCIHDPQTCDVDCDPAPKIYVW